MNFSILINCSAFNSKWLIFLGIKPLRIDFASSGCLSEIFIILTSSSQIRVIFCSFLTSLVCRIFPVNNEPIFKSEAFFSCSEIITVHIFVTGSPDLAVNFNSLLINSVFD
ncbi:unnamed protein product [Moneuplotes crassus]|uniref:Uncharacterized protein n=1 Tax=Euplotes crassus TaxID=5936 RepID=A0AAD1UK89_EUPCR|nr:unnamed protein product [Moneuplotes crassus]